MNNILIDNLIIGEGIPKICVPTVAKNIEEMIEQAEIIKKLPVDLVELRIDYFIESKNVLYINEAITRLKNIVNKPVILTFRTAFEGGSQEISREDYSKLLNEILNQENVDIIDVELFTAKESLIDIVNNAHKYGTKVIMSNHDFDKTPNSAEIVSRLHDMEKFGADIAKIAVMPNSSKDVIELLDATREAYETMNIPIVTMSMTKKGLISRVSGEFFGSAITFGTALNASAPGQINANELDKIIKILHMNV